MTPAGPGRDAAAAAVILAAGAGVRMGGPKALLPFEGRLLVERAVQTALQGECAHVVVVLGAAAEQVLRRADLRGARTVVNERWREGMGGSLRTGLGQVALLARGSAPGLDAALVLLVDQPFVTAAAVRAVLAAWRGGARLAAASYGGRRGHPVLFGREHWAAVSGGAAGDAGARDFLAAQGPRLVLVPCDGIADPRDLDAPGDLDPPGGCAQEP